ncbi:hypothetical protein [Geoalkalibacter sp.]|uniref:hypothetical protein n=1 Tax=Geoalkalibacter sp. TaxID=3041440 RepID=UPI00272E7068|nr:hypothetical protein [Geoalkalibacter sp.]
MIDLAKISQWQNMMEAEFAAIEGDLQIVVRKAFWQGIATALEEDAKGRGLTFRHAVEMFAGEVNWAADRAKMRGGPFAGF